MKIIAIILGLIGVAFGVVQFFALKSQWNIETYPYTVIKSYEKFETRSYEATLFTSVEMSSDVYKKASRKGFGVLAGYIFGNNDRNEKIAMTSPVSMSIEEDRMTMMFMVPSKLKKEQLPKPNESRIVFKEEPAKKVAAISFGGWANDVKIARYKNRLIKALEAQGISYSKRFYFFGYNAPYEVFNRKNEIIVELE
ncbi:MAG: SOUL family heme-binding protein [Flavicella sp.]